MDLYVKKIPIKSLTLSKLSTFCNQKNRYNCVTDLAHKSKEQINVFINRVHDLYYEFFKQRDKKYFPLTKSSLEVEIYLSVVFCKSNSELELEGFPLYDFLSFDVREKNSVLSSGFGVMLSTYTHDFDREKLKEGRIVANDISLSINLWKSLFETTKFNEGKPPLLNQYPVFVFPQTKYQNSSSSTTNDYMSYLGLTMINDYSLSGEVMRIFYKKGDPQISNSKVYLAILAIGQVLLEMTNPDIYQGNSQLMPFNRGNFTAAVKLKQKESFINWLSEHNLLDYAP